MAQYCPCHLPSVNSSLRGCECVGVCVRAARVTLTGSDDPHCALCHSLVARMHGPTPRQSLTLASLDECADGAYSEDETVRSALLSRRSSDLLSIDVGHQLSLSALRTVYVVSLVVLVLFGLLLCASLTSTAISAPLAASSSVRSPVALLSFTPLPSVHPPQQPNSENEMPALHTATSGTTKREEERPGQSDQSIGGASEVQSASSSSSPSTPISTAAVAGMTPVSNAAGVRYAMERRHNGYIARENYNINSNHILTLDSAPTHAGCKPTEPAANTYQCDIFNITEALTVCNTMEQCVGVVCWKEHWEGCQLKGRPVRHENNHRFVSPLQA